MQSCPQEVVVKLIELIYDASLAPGKWVEFLDALGDAVDGHTLNLSSLNPDFDFGFVAVAKTDRAFAEDYAEYYWKLDPWLDAGRRHQLLQPGFSALGEMFVSPSVLEKTEFHNDLGRRFEVVGGISAVLEVEQSLVALSVSQHASRQFGESQLELVRALIPHVRRALSVQMRLQGAEARAADATFALDYVSDGIFLVSATGKLLFANAAGEKILRARDGLSVSRGELHASTPAQTSRLRQAITNAIHASRRVVLPGQPIEVFHRPSGLRPLSLLVAPLPTHRFRLGQEPACAAMFVTDHDRRPVTSMEAIRLVLCLTTAEARLVQCLVNGHSVKEAAALLSIGVETARKRLKVIFQKTDTHRQSDLVRLALRCTAPELR